MRPRARPPAAVPCFRRHASGAARLLLELRLLLAGFYVISALALTVFAADFPPAFVFGPPVVSLRL